MHTPDEARALWCPHASALVVGQAAGQQMPLGFGNRLPHGMTSGKIGDSSDNPDFARCIANRCAAWRWNGPARTHGFCGLSGPGSAIKPVMQ